MAELASDPTRSGARLSQQAEVYKSGQPAGLLSRTPGGGVQFEYLAEYVAHRHRAIATSLPLSRTPVQTPAGGVPNFFSGLLPEGRRLETLRAKVKTSADDELSLLLTVGRDTPGDVQIMEPGHAAGSVPASSPVDAETPYIDSLPDADFHELAEKLDLVSLPGVQPKVSYAMLTAPLRTKTAPVLIKFNPPSYPELVDNEAAHLAAARKLRIPVVKAKVLSDRLGRHGLVVNRFDRVKDGSDWVRLAFEDATQVMDLPPADKYNVSTEDLCAALMTVCEAPLVAARNLYLQFLFAWLTGNGDLHAKNVGVLATNSGLGPAVYQIAPVYDVPSTLPYGNETLALPVNGKTRRLRARDWAALADRLGLNPKVTAQLQRIALGAAATVDLGSLGFAGSVLNGANRELRHRRAEMET